MINELIDVIILKWKHDLFYKEECMRNIALDSSPWAWYYKAKP